MPSSNTLDFNWSTFNPLDHQKKSRFVAVFLLVVVVVLHMTLTWFLLNAPKTEHKKPPVIMEIALLPTPEPIVKQVLKEPPPAPPPAKKEPVKPKPVVKPPVPVKKPVKLKKPAPTPKPKAIPAATKEAIPVPKFEPVPAFIPAPPVSAPSPAASTSVAASSKAAAKPAATAGQGRDNSKSVVSGVVPLVRVPPKYPARAASRHIEGWVKIEFTVQTDGSVDNAVVVASEPENIFDDAALTAISKWKFKEKIVNGVAVTQRAVQKLQFKLNQ